MRIDSKQGSATALTVISCMLVVFVLLPVFCAAAHKWLLYQKRLSIHASAEMALYATYVSLQTEQAAMGIKHADPQQMRHIFETVLFQNLHMDENGYPEEDSWIIGPISVRTIEVIAQNMEQGNKYTSFVCVISIPMRRMRFFVNPTDVAQTIELVETVAMDLPFDR